MESTLDSFEKLKFDPFGLNNNVLVKNLSDPDINFFNENNIQNLDTPYFDITEAKASLETMGSNSFSILHLNIRSMNKNFENFKTFLFETCHTFSMICLTETWLTDDAFKNISNYHLNDYTGIHFERKTGSAGGGVCVYIRKTLMFKNRIDLSVSDADNESLVIEIINEKSKNIIVNTTYRQPDGNIKSFKTQIKKFFDLTAKENKKLFLLGDYNINCLNYDTNANVRNILNLYFSHGMIPVINKPTRVTKNTQTAIDNIFLNSFFNTQINTGIIKTCISDHFPIFIVANDITLSLYPKTETIFKRIISENALKEFKVKLSKINWNDTLNENCPDKSYTKFIETFSTIYETCFPLKKIKVKVKSLLNPWFTKGILKSSKRKQKLYNKFLKKRNDTNESEYKSYKNMFE